jgi:hypothetical protein
VHDAHLLYPYESRLVLAIADDRTARPGTWLPTDERDGSDIDNGRFEQEQGEVGVGGEIRGMDNIPDDRIGCAARRRWEEDGRDLDGAVRDTVRGREDHRGADQRAGAEGLTVGILDDEARDGGVGARRNAVEDPRDAGRGDGAPGL